MRIAVVNETSAADRNGDILKALDGRGHEVINVGMTKNGAKPELQYYNTALMAAILLNLKRVDFVVGGCGTGQGFMTAVSMYPGIVCGHIMNDLDAWLFAQINNGNCISLALNQYYGWAADVNLGFIFDRLFSVSWGSGYPPHRAEPQQASRRMLDKISLITHRPLAEIMLDLPDAVVQPVLTFPDFIKLVNLEAIETTELKAAFQKRMV